MSKHYRTSSCRSGHVNSISRHFYKHGLFRHARMKRVVSSILVLLALSFVPFAFAQLPGAVESKPTAFTTAGKEADGIAGLSDGKVSAKARLFILAVGINEYKNPRYTLKYGRPDAEAFVQAVESHGVKVFGRILKQTLYDTQATRGAIEAAFQRIISKALPDDVFVFYYAGHGVMSKGGGAKKPEFYLAPTDVTKLYGDDEMLAERGISARMLKDLSARVKAQKQLIVLDSCNSGGALEAFEIPATQEGKGCDRNARETGITVLAAAGAAQPATEFRELGHGVFTYALLKGLSGEADDGTSPDGKITVKKLVSYINTKVPELIKQYRGKAQNPNSFARGKDFQLGIR